MRKITEMTQEGEIDSPWVSPIGQFTDDALAEDLAEDEEFRRIWEETATERHIARQIVHYRTSHGLSQQELAARVGTSHSQISRMESGRYPTRVGTLKRIGDALGLNLTITYEPKGEVVAAHAETTASQGVSTSSATRRASV